MKSDQKRFLDVCELSARVETNVPRAGDAGRGGKTRIVLSDVDGFAFGGPDGYAGSAASVEVEVLGDAEA